jgi:hypothetical protein
MMFEILTYILGILVVILGYTTINLLIKNEKAEDIILSQNKFISTMHKVIQDSEIKLDELDSKETFKSDDEIGWLFEEIRKLHTSIFNFINNSVHDKKKK